MLFNWLKNRAKKRQIAENIYAVAANQARHPHFYQTLMVPDSITGRYELLCLHVFLLLERLREEKTPIARSISQNLTEILVKELERAYRDNGFRDLSIPKNVKKLIGGFYERAGYYKICVAQNDKTTLSNHLKHYIYRTNQSKEGTQPEHDCASELALYTLAAHAHLKKRTMEEIKTVNFAFLSPEVDQN